MSAPSLLTDEQFSTCFSPPMQDVTEQAEAIVDIWPYVDAVDPTSLSLVGQIHDVMHVYRDGAGRYEHVLIETDLSNIFLVIVIDRQAQTIFGHHILDLGKLYSVRA